MLVTCRSRAALALTLFSLAACSDETKLSTDLDAAAVTEDVSLTQAAFESSQTQALAGVGDAIDRAIANFGGVAAVGSMAVVVAAGPDERVDPRSARAVLARVGAMTATEAAPIIPTEVVGKTLVWNTTTEEYQLASPAIAGAPANGVRFRLYEIDEVTGNPAVPLVHVGNADITLEGTDAVPAVRLKVLTTGGVAVLEYLGTLGGTPTVPQFRLEGFAGVGQNRATFTLNVNLNTIQENIAVDWRASIAARNLTTRTSLGIGVNAFTLSGLLQRGASKIEVAGSINFLTGGTATVKVGNAVFALVTVDSEGEVTVTNADGGALTPEEEETLLAIVDLFGSVFEWYDGLLEPVAAVMDVAFDE